MRTVIDGQGNDSTAAVKAWLKAGRAIDLATLYLIGEAEEPNAIWLTDCSVPLTWSIWGTFLPSNISRGTVKSEIGFKVATLDVSWKPTNQLFTQDITTTSPYQQAWLGVFDNRPFRSWTVYLPSKGDANTFGASELFGGRIAGQEVVRGEFKLTVNSFLDVVNQMVPGAVIENLNSIAGFLAATPPRGLTQVPTFVVTSATQGLVNAACLTPNAGQVFDHGAFQGGFIYFTSGVLQGMWSAAADNFEVGGANQFVLYRNFPWPPQLGDTFYASASIPMNLADAVDYPGLVKPFPYIAEPESAV